MRTHFYAVIAMITCTAGAFAQGATETFNAEATVVTPISITVDSDLNFGTIAVSATTGGTAVFDTSGVLTTTGGVTLPADAVDTPTAAAFTVNGEADYTYSITLPAPFDITETVASTATMTVTLSEAATGTLTLGTETVTLGAQLDVAAAQAGGIYNGTFDVTVDYN